MADTTDYERLRQDVNATIDSLPDTEAADLFVQAEALYSDANSQLAHTRVAALRRLLAQAATVTSYTQNNSREELGKVFDNYLKLLDVWQKALAEAEGAVNTAMGAARFGRTNSKPSRLMEYPDPGCVQGSLWPLTVNRRKWGY